MQLITKRPSGSTFVLCLLITGIIILYAQTELVLMKTGIDKKIPADEQDNFTQQTLDSLYIPVPVQYQYR